MSLQDWFGGPYTPDRVVKMTTAIIGIFAVITIAANTMGLAEPYWIATRGFMREHVQEVLKSQHAVLADATNRQIGIEIRIEQSEHRRIRAKISDLELELKKNPGAPEGLLRAIEDQIAEQKLELQNKEAVINGLRQMQKKAP